MVQPWLDDHHMMTMEVDSLDAMLQSSGPDFPYNRTFQEAKMDPVVVLHTSGSTGLPKPVVARVGMVAAGDAMHNLPSRQGTVFALRAWNEQSKRHFMPSQFYSEIVDIDSSLTNIRAVPLFHAAGLLTSIHAGIYWDRPLAFGVDRPMSAGLIADSIDCLDIELAILPPSILSAMSQEDDCVRSLKKLKLIVFGGGKFHSPHAEITNS
jgi:hypothetical protein